MHKPAWYQATALSQSEDQSRPHPAPAFVHSMSTQVRGLGLGVIRGALRPDPQIATRTAHRTADARQTTHSTT